MVRPHTILETLTSLGVDFYSGVPDSILNPFRIALSRMARNSGSGKVIHEIVTNEGCACSLGVGRFLATGKVPVVYGQNSGFGNMINPLLSLMHREVYAIPMIIFVGWRGGPMSDSSIVPLKVELPRSQVCSSQMAPRETDVSSKKEGFAKKSYEGRFNAHNCSSNSAISSQDIRIVEHRCDKDEPQHMVMGRVQVPMLHIADLPYDILPYSEVDSREMIKRVYESVQEYSHPHIILVKRNTFEAVENQEFGDHSEISEIVDNSGDKRLRGYLKRDADSAGVTPILPANRQYPSQSEAMKRILEIMHRSQETPIVCSTGFMCRNLYKLREDYYGGDHSCDFLMVGSMGYASSIATGMASSGRSVVCLDGDGSLGMHLGSMLTSANYPILHIIFNNGIHESVGGGRTALSGINIATLAMSCGYHEAVRVLSLEELDRLVSLWVENANWNTPVSTLLDVRIRRDHQSSFCRPSVPLQDLRDSFTKRFSPKC